MDVFDNCRICLHEINHEPIKMTRLILRFLEKCLQLTNVIKPYPQSNVKQNLCAPCFNRISEFQDFHEQCKDSDEFWKTQFEDIKEITLEKQLIFEQSVLLPLAEESNSLEADTTVSTTDTKQSTYPQQETEEQHDDIHSLQGDIEENMHEVYHAKENNMLNSPPLNEEDEETTQIEDFNSIDLTNWPDDTNDDDCEIKALGESESDAAKDINEEIIEYEYQIEDEEEVEIEEIPTADEPASSESFGVDYRSFNYEKVETENSGESSIIHETIEEIKEEYTETTQNAFFMTTTIDENGKVKMSYKCQHCGKCAKFFLNIFINLQIDQTICYRFQKTSEELKAANPSPMNTFVV